MEKVTISDLASELNLSKTLVSMVLNGKGNKYNISKATQKRVIEHAKKRNYRPNQNARSLRTGKSDSIGLIVPDISNGFFSKIARVLEGLLEKQNKRLIISSTDENPEREKELVNFMMSTNVDGIITASCLKDAQFYKDVKKSGFPVVLIDRRFERSNLPYVIVNNYHGAKNAVNRMVDSGRKNVYMLTLTPAYISPLKDRAEGFADALESNGINSIPSRCIEVNHNTIERDVETKVEPILKQDKVDAFFVTNNQLAMSLLKVLNDKGIKVPEEMSVISFDDVPVFGLTTPQLSAIAQPVENIARNAARLILDTQNKDAKTSIELPTDFVDRGSV